MTTTQALTRVEEPVKLTLSEKAEAVICTGDLTQLSAEERVTYYKMRCEAVGLDYRTEPFLYVLLNGKLKLYATKTATEQLAANRHISLSILEEKGGGDAYRVKVRATLPDGQYTDSTGAVWTKGLVGDAYCNALMKAETKAKRRAVLSITGCGAMDETEVDDSPNAARVNPDEDKSADTLAVRTRVLRVLNQREAVDLETGEVGPLLPVDPNEAGGEAEPQLRPWEQVRLAFMQAELTPFAVVFANVLGVPESEIKMQEKNPDFASFKANIATQAEADAFLAYARNGGM